MLKIMKLFNISILKKNKNNNEVIKFDDNTKELANKLEKLLKLGKISKSKKLSKSRNFSKNNIMEKSSFLAPNTKIIFNYL